MQLAYKKLSLRFPVVKHSEFAMFLINTYTCDLEGGQHQIHSSLSENQRHYFQYPSILEAEHNWMDSPSSKAKKAHQSQLKYIQDSLSVQLGIKKRV